MKTKILTENSHRPILIKPLSIFVPNVGKINQITKAIETAVGKNNFSLKLIATAKSKYSQSEGYFAIAKNLSNQCKFSHMLVKN